MIKFALAFALATVVSIGTAAAQRQDPAPSGQQRQDPAPSGQQRQDPAPSGQQRQDRPRRASSVRTRRPSRPSSGQDPAPSGQKK